MSDRDYCIPSLEYVNRYLYRHKSLPKAVAKDVVDDILSETQSAEVDNETICKRINLVIRNWTCFASYWNKGVVIDEETDSQTFLKFKKLPEDQQKYLATESHFDGLVPPADLDAYYDYLESLETDDVWQANLRLKRLCERLSRVHDSRNNSQSIREIQECENLMKKEMDSYQDKMNLYIIQYVSSTIIKGYLKYGRDSLAESLIDFMSPKLSSNKNWFPRGKLTYYVFKGESAKVNELKNDFMKLRVSPSLCFKVETG